MDEDLLTEHQIETYNNLLSKMKSEFLLIRGFLTSETNTVKLLKSINDLKLKLIIQYDSDDYISNSLIKDIINDTKKQTSDCVDCEFYSFDIVTQTFIEYYNFMNENFIKIINTNKDILKPFFSALIFIFTIYVNMYIMY